MLQLICEHFYRFFEIWKISLGAKGYDFSNRIDAHFFLQSHSGNGSQLLPSIIIIFIECFHVFQFDWYRKLLSTYTGNDHAFLTCNRSFLIYICFRLVERFEKRRDYVTKKRSEL